MSGFTVLDGEGQELVAPELNAVLIDLIKAGDVSTVIDYLRSTKTKKDWDINISSPIDGLPLGYAVSLNRLDMVSVILSQAKNANPFTRDGDGQSALELAVQTAVTAVANSTPETLYSQQARAEDAVQITRHLMIAAIAQGLPKLHAETHAAASALLSGLPERHPIRKDLTAVLAGKHLVATPTETKQRLKHRKQAEAERATAVERVTLPELLREVSEAAAGVASPTGSAYSCVDAPPSPKGSVHSISSGSESDGARSQRSTGSTGSTESTAVLVEYPPASPAAAAAHLPAPSSRALS